VHCPLQVAYRAVQEDTRLLQASLGNRGSKSCFRVSAMCANLLQCFSLKVSQGVKGLNGSHSLVFFLLKINTSCLLSLEDKQIFPVAAGGSACVVCSAGSYSGSSGKF
jgi:hypothetical protein